MTDIVPSGALQDLMDRMRSHGADSVYLKRLAPNDNSKNQIYLGNSLKAASVLPVEGLVIDPPGNGEQGYKAPLKFAWLDDDGELARAPRAQLVLYPQYPEVRLSGILQGITRSVHTERTRSLISSRDEGRILFLGVGKSDGVVFGRIEGPDSSVASVVNRLPASDTGVLEEVALVPGGAASQRQRLVCTLADISEMNWVGGRRLDRNGSAIPFNASNAGGYTLEALLGVVPNALSEPDFAGWEVKTYTVSSFGSTANKAITLMTPEPTGGFYRDAGAEAFVRRYGYEDTRGRDDRLNFGGVHSYGQEHVRTELVLTSSGFDSRTGQITDPAGAFILRDRAGNEAARWDFPEFVEHWIRKHSRAVYVPNLVDVIAGERSYMFGGAASLGTGTDFSRFMQAMAAGAVYYDPGISLKAASSSSPRIKCRSQFRIKSRDLVQLYNSFESVDTAAECSSGRASVARPVQTTGIGRRGRNGGTGTGYLPVMELRNAPPFSFIDLFAGIGGFRHGFEAVGGQCVFTSEWDRFSRKTYEANFLDGHPIAGDITAVHASEIPPHDVLLGGFPCQPFSLAGVSKKNSLGRAHGFEDETQGTLFFDVVRILKYHRPAAFLLENVKNLVSHDRGRTLQVIKRALKELGYHFDTVVIDAKGWVPQHRQRIFIAGMRTDTGFSFDDFAARPVEGGPTLASILHPEDGSEEPEEPYTEGPDAKVSDRYTLSDKLWQYLQDYADKHRAAGNGFGFGLVGPDDTSRTLSARYHKDGSEILVRRPEGNPRRLTPRECARLMGFDRPGQTPMEIPVSDTQAYRQFGNAVVVPVVEAVASWMRPSLNAVLKTPEQAHIRFPSEAFVDG